LGRIPELLLDEVLRKKMILEIERASAKCKCRTGFENGGWRVVRQITMNDLKCPRTCNGSSETSSERFVFK
jgi:hypothetical protein